MSRFLPTFGQGTDQAAILISKNQTNPIYAPIVEQTNGIKIRLNEPFFNETANVISKRFF